MFVSWRWLACLVFTLGSMLLVLPSATEAGKPKTESAEEREKRENEERDNYLTDLTMAYRLMEQADAELKKKRADKPGAAASLLAAAATFRRISGVSLKATIEEKPLTENSKGEKVTGAIDQVEDPPNLSALAEGLLVRAQNLSTKEKLNLDAVIKGIKECERDTFGGPKHISRVVGADQRHTYHIEVVPLKPVHFTFHSSFPMRVTVVRGDNDNPYGVGNVGNVNTTFHPGPSKTGKVPLTIRVHNIGHQAGSYQMFVN
jgi:hypothetical protein